MAPNVIDLTEALEQRLARRQGRLAELVAALGDVAPSDAALVLDPAVSRGLAPDEDDEGLAAVARALVRLRRSGVPASHLASCP